MAPTSFLSKIHNSLLELAREETANTLGNRSNYIGMSDAVKCPRQVVVDKTMPPVDHDLKTLLRFKRGHIVEDILADAFTHAGMQFERQVEIVSDRCTAPFITHIDFVFTSERSKIKAVLEVKSQDNEPPATPWSNWEMQLHGQIAKVQRKDPDYTVKGAILAMPLGGDIRFWDGYTPCDEILVGLEARVESMWSAIESVKSGAADVDDVTSCDVSPLCGFCHALSSCPKFAAEEVPELDFEAQTILEIDKMIKELETSSKREKEKLLKIVDVRGPFIAYGQLWQRAKREKTNTDLKALGDFLSGLGHDLKKFQKPNPYSFLEHKKAV